MAFNASFDTQCVLNKILSTPAIEEDIPQDLKKSDRVHLLNELKSQIISGVESHYRQNFGDVLEQTSRMMGMQSELNHRLEERNSELRTNFLSTYEMCQILKFEKDSLEAKLSHEAEKYQALLESNRQLLGQIVGINKSSFDVEQTLGDMHDTITRLSLMIEVSRSMSSFATPVAQINIPHYRQAFDDVPPVSPATPAATRGSFPVFTEAGVPVEMDPPTDGSLADEIEQLKARMVELEAGANTSQGLQGEVLQLHGRLEQLVCEREALRAQLDLSLAENLIRAKQAEKLEHSVWESHNDQARAMEEHAGACLELAALRKEHDELQRRVRVAENECERVRDEKMLALKTNKHLETTNKELKHRFKHIKESIAESVKTELKKELRKEWDDFYQNCKIDSEVICQTGVELAEEAHQAQVRYYQRTADMGARYIDMISTVAELREYLVKHFDHDGYKHEPPALQESLIMLNKQLKNAVAHNYSLQEQLKTQDIFIHSSDQAPLYHRCLDIETKIEYYMRVARELKEEVNKKDREIVKLRHCNDECEHRLRLMQSDLLFQSRLVECDSEKGQLQALQREFNKAFDFA
jgi:hypothetical protein